MDLATALIVNETERVRQVGSPAWIRVGKLKELLADYQEYNETDVFERYEQFVQPGQAYGPIDSHGNMTITIDNRNGTEPVSTLAPLEEVILANKKI